MKVMVDINLINALIECIEKQAVIGGQPSDVQLKWQEIINDTVRTAKGAVQQYMNTEGYGDPRRTETGMGPLLSPDKTSFL